MRKGLRISLQINEDRKRMEGSAEFLKHAAHLLSCGQKKIKRGRFSAEPILLGPPPPAPRCTGR